MANKSPRTRLVNIPAEYLPLIVKERDDKGLFTTSETMGQILRNHFDNHDNSADSHDNSAKSTKNNKSEVLKGVPINE